MIYLTFTPNPLPFWPQIHVVDVGSRKDTEFLLHGMKLCEWGIARPSGRAWIETSFCLSGYTKMLRIARPSGRAWIETEGNRLRNQLLPVSPGLQVGRGLKRGNRAPGRRRKDVSPGLQVGRGLKRQAGRGDYRCYQVSPGLQVGRGLKQAIYGIASGTIPYRPAFRSGVD